MVRVGDELAFFLNSIYGRHWRLHKVKKITKRGSVCCGPYVLTPALELCGNRLAGLRVERAPSQIKAEVEAYKHRVRAIEKLRQVNFATLTNEQLAAVVGIVNC